MIPLPLTEDDIAIIDDTAWTHIIITGKNLNQLKQQILDDYEKARKWDNLKTTNKCVKSIGLDRGYNQNQKLRELVEKYYKHADLTISSICKQMLEECKE